MTQTTETPPTVITLTLPTPEGGRIAQERATATLLIRRSDLTQVRQFHYTGYLPDVMEAIHWRRSRLPSVTEAATCMDA